MHGQEHRRRGARLWIAAAFALAFDAPAFAQSVVWKRELASAKDASGASYFELTLRQFQGKNEDPYATLMCANYSGIDHNGRVLDENKGVMQYRFAVTGNIRDVRISPALKTSLARRKAGAFHLQAGGRSLRMGYSVRDGMIEIEPDPTLATGEQIAPLIGHLRASSTSQLSFVDQRGDVLLTMPFKRDGLDALMREWVSRGCAQ